MARKPIEQGKLIYHLTAIENMESILKNGLKSRSNLNNQFTDVADPNIISYRNEFNLTNYVPFHFFAPSPFAGAVQKNHPLNTFVYIAIQRKYANYLKAKIIPEHPMSLEQKYAPEILDYDSGIKEIDWEILNMRDYSNHYCHKVCLAECLLPSPLSIYKCINEKQVTFFVKDESVEQSLYSIYNKLYPNNKIKINILINEAMFVN